MGDRKISRSGIAAFVRHAAGDRSTMKGEKPERLAHLERLSGPVCPNRRALDITTIRIRIYDRFADDWRSIRCIMK
jgi:hypothetical protein